MESWRKLMAETQPTIGEEMDYEIAMLKRRIARAEAAGIEDSATRSYRSRLSDFIVQRSKTQPSNG